MRSRRSLVFPISTEDVRLRWLLNEFRLIVNKSIRIAHRQDIRSRARLSAVTYRDLSREHSILKQYIPAAHGVALGLLKACRRRAGERGSSGPPYVRRPLLRAVNQAYRFDQSTGRLRISIRARNT